MVTAPKAVKRYAEAMWIPRVRTERTALILRTADGGDDLWPTSGRGGGIKAARPKVPQLVNFGLASVVANPLSEAPELVRRYRKMVPAKHSRLVMFGMFGSDPEDWAKSEEYVSGLIKEICPGETLGDMLESLVRYLMSTDQPTEREGRRAFARKFMRCLTVHRFRFPGGAIGASLEFNGGSQSFREITPGLFPQMTEDGSDNPDMPPAAIHDLSSMPYRLFEIMADLALDTERELGQSASSDAASSTAAKDAETTTPATVGAGPAHVDKASQPGANPVNPADSSNQQDSDEKERGQSPAPSSPRGSPSSNPSDRPKDEPPWPISSSRMQSAD
jgi:hypothetical protein